MHRRTENNTHGIRHDVLPAPVVALLMMVVQFLGYSCHYAYDRAEDGQAEAHY